LLHYIYIDLDSY